MAMRARGTGGKKRPPVKAAATKRTRAKAAAPTKTLRPGDEGFRRPARGNGAAAVVEAEAESTDAVYDAGSVATVPSGQALAVRDMADGGEISSPFGRPLSGDASGGRRPKRTIRQLIRESFDLRGVRATPYGLTPLLILAAGGFFSGVSNRAFQVAGPEIARALEINVGNIISISIVVGFFSIFVSLFAGWWADRHRRVPFLAAGTFLNGLFSGVIASRGTSTLTLGAPRVIGESAEVFGDVPYFSLLADYYPVEVRGRVFASVSTLRRMGQLVSVFLVGALVTGIGFRSTFVLTGASLMVIGVLTFLRLREPVRGYMERRALGVSDDVARTEDEPQSFGEGWRTTWGIRTLRRIFIADCILGMTGLVTLYFGFFLAEEYGLNAWERSLILVPGILAGLFGGLMGGSLIDTFMSRKPSRVLLLIGGFQLLGILPYALYALTPPLWLIVLVNIPLTFGSALIGPASSVIYSQVIPASIRTQGLQMFNLTLVPGFLFGGVLLGAVLDASGYPAVFLMTIPFGIVGALTFMSAANFFELDMRSAFASTVANEEWRRAKRSGKGKLLVCRDVEVAYGNVQVLFGVDFDVEEGEIIALLGTNGAGKSTLLRAISGTTEATSGAIVFDGRDITHMPPHEITARAVIHMPGGRGVFPGLTVRENLLLGNWLNDDPAEVKTRMEDVYRIFPRLAERADTNASDLSGGEQQQLSLAQAFLCKPKLLMIDELSLGLAPAVVAELLEIVRGIRDSGVTIIVVEQSVNVALTIAEKAIFMEKGEVKFFGRTDDLLSRPDILRAVYVKGTGALTDSASRAGRSQRDQRQLDLGSARPVLEVEGLEKRYGGITAVDGISLSLREGEVLGLIGPNGSGKTTTFDLISGYQIPDAGVVRFEGVDITEMSPEERARRKLVRRFQDARLFPALTVFETLLVALDQRLESKAAFFSAAGLPQARKAERRLRVRAEQLIELLELGSYRDKFVKELSTGLRRIVDIACVLASEPRVLLLDEPSSGIAQREAESLAPLLRRIRFETGCSILIIEHDMSLISSVSDELVALDRGRVLLRGTPEAVLNDDRVIESYLGTSEAAVQRSGSSR